MRKRGLRGITFMIKLMFLYFFNPDLSGGIFAATLLLVFH